MLGACSLRVEARVREGSIIVRGRNQALLVSGSRFRSEEREKARPLDRRWKLIQEMTVAGLGMSLSSRMLA